jgi:hypothetical protein
MAKATAVNLEFLPSQELPRQEMYGLNTQIRRCCFEGIKDCRGLGTRVPARCIPRHHSTVEIKPMLAAPLPKVEADRLAGRLLNAH